MPLPSLSIILTSHHRSFLLERAIDSLLVQNFTDFEIILCADEGDLLTRNMASKKLRQFDSFLSLPNFKGPSETRNLGLQIAKGNWICFLDDDDSFQADYFFNAVKYLNDSDTLYYFNYSKITESRIDNSINEQIFLDVYHENICKDFIYVENYIPINTFFINSTVAKCNFFDPFLQTHEDWDWLISLKSKSGIQFTHVPIFGPKVHISPDESRNTNINSGTVHALDSLSIYRKWPGIDESIRIARYNRLSERGLGIPQEFL